LKTKRKPKNTSTAKLKRRLWPIFSLYIRLRDANSSGYARCVTCNKLYHVKQLQAGHFVPGRHNSILYDERNVHAQCYLCNMILKGNPRKYDAFMRAKYGQDVIDELDSMDADMRRWTPAELLELIQHYKQRVKELSYKI
jgi:hypothetical protein